MKNAVVSALLAAPTLVAGATYLTPIHNFQHLDYKLVDEAMIIIPVDNPEYADAAENLYLAPSGFDGGVVSTLNMPEVISGAGLNGAVNYGVSELVNAVEQEYDGGQGDISADSPLYIFGYSQSSVVMGMAEQQLYADDIPSQDLNFVMVGDSASAEGGFLNTFLNEFPAAWQPYVIDAFKHFRADEVLGQVTPDKYYPTEVYSLSGDGWANYDGGLNNGGLFTDHLEYLGLTPSEIASAGAPVTDGMTEYFTIQDSMVNSLEALWTQLQIAASVLF
jgi:hypothetical protein